MGRSEKQAVAVLALGVALILVAGVYLSLPARSPEELRKTPTSDSSDATVASAGPRLPETPTLQKAIRGCEVDREEECVQRFVAEAAPGAKYVGGRVDLDANRDNRNVRVMYFEAPSLEPCEYA